LGFMSSRFYFWLFLIFLLLLRFGLTRPEFRDGQKIRLVRESVRNEPLRFGDRQSLTLKGLKVYLPLYPEIEYGDKVTVEGEVNLSKKSLEKARLVEVKKGGSFYTFRNRLVDFYQSSLPQPAASLISGLVLGSKEGLPAWFWNDLKKTGTAHIVVASGMNVSLIAVFLLGLLVSFLPRRRALILALVGVWVYAFLVGFEAPIIRAALMGTIALTAMFLGRPSLVLNSLALTCWLMLFIFPDWLFDVGFLLSFAATLSLVLFERKLSAFFRFLPSFLKESVSTSLAAQILTSPILYFTFGYISLVSPLVNCLILWTVPLMTVLGIIAGFLSFLWPFLAKAILLLTYPLAFWLIETVKLFSF